MSMTREQYIKCLTNWQNDDYDPSQDKCFKLIDEGMKRKNKSIDVIKTSKENLLKTFDTIDQFVVDPYLLIVKHAQKEMDVYQINIQKRSETNKNLYIKVDNYNDFYLKALDYHTGYRRSGANYKKAELLNLLDQLKNYSVNSLFL